MAPMEPHLPLATKHAIAPRKPVRAALLEILSTLTEMHVYWEIQQSLLVMMEVTAAGRITQHATLPNKVFSLSTLRAQPVFERSYLIDGNLGRCCARSNNLYSVLSVIPHSLGSRQVRILASAFRFLLCYSRC